MHLKNDSRAHRATSAFALAALLAVSVPQMARAQSEPACDAPLGLLRFANPLGQFARKLASGEPIVIVAIGSSSTAGAGASSTAANYPSRLEAELRERLPGRPIRVINRGIGGEAIGEMLERFDRAVVAAKPDLVLWQLGTNSVLRRDPVAGQGAAIRAGIAKLRAIGADAVLVDPQYAPKVIDMVDARGMLALISATAKQENVDLFPRFAMMKHWHDKNHLAFDVFLSRDGLHMNDWSYACMAKGLALAIAEAATRPALSVAGASAESGVPR